MSWAVVTGASRGIGRATSIALARRGVSVALLGPAVERLADAAAQVEAEGVRALRVACDVSDEASVVAAARRVLGEIDPPDVVVHNAGIIHRGANVEDVSLASFSQVIATNLTGPFLVTRAFLPAMRARNRGRFVFVGSISSTLGSPGAASYAASKWGVVGLARSLAEELRGSALTAMSVLPGSVDTDMLRGSGFEPKMTADDVAGTIVYAALDAPPAMNGSTLEVFG